MAQQPIRSPISGMRVPPQSIDAEMALLGSILIKPDILFEVMDLIRPDSFYLSKHSTIFEAILELTSKGEAIDALTLSAKLKGKNQFDKIGGVTYLSDLSNTVPSAANAKYYAEIVQRKYISRNLISVADEISEHGYNESNEIGELLDFAEKKIYSVSGLIHANEYVSLPNELASAYERVERLQDSGDGMRGTPTGFKALDAKLSGLQRADLIIIAARPSVGKTSLALDIARQSALQHGTSVLMFSLEMSSQQLVDRMLAAESRVDAWRLRTGKVNTSHDFGLLRDALDRLSKASIYIDDKAGNTILQMRSIARRIKRQHGLNLIVVDYLQLMLPSGRFKNSESMVHQVTEISRSLKILARELDVPVVALSQLSRAVEQRGGRPRLSDLRDSGSIEQDADVVMFIHREDKTKEHSNRPNIADIIIAKHRNGPTGEVQLYFDDKKATFTELEQSDFEDINMSDDFADF